MPREREKSKNRPWDGLTRRQLFGAGALGLVSLCVPDWLKLLAASPSPATQTGNAQPAKARSVILLWMGGGPCHIDTFDPKPGAGEDYCGPLRRAIPTNVPGMQLNESLPLLAKQADKFSLLRGMTHPFGGHETATYAMQTGTMPSTDLVYPAMGAVVAYKRQELGTQGTLPPYVTVTSSLGRFSEAGFLGPAYQPFATGGDVKAKDFRPNGLTTPSNVSADRVQQRRELLGALDTMGHDLDTSPQVHAMNQYQRKTYELLLGEAKKAFDLSLETDAMRDRYGRNDFGQSCLLARRLVENGVPFVTVNSGGWDTHTKHFEQMEKKLPVLDQGFSVLLDDLAKRGLLASTIVVWAGEFGRTPKVVKDPPFIGGRHHFPNAFSCVVAGGGFAGGKIVGVTDGRGEKVLQRPVYPWDLSASIYKLMGIDPNGRLPHPQGRVVYVSPPSPGGTKFPGGGMLKEIM
jgi:hypothetical protein